MPASWVCLREALGDHGLPLYDDVDVEAELVGWPGPDPRDAGPELHGLTVRARLCLEDPVAFVPDGIALDPRPLLTLRQEGLLEDAILDELYRRATDHHLW